MSFKIWNYLIDHYVRGNISEIFSRNFLKSFCDNFLPLTSSWPINTYQYKGNISSRFALYWPFRDGWHTIVWFDYTVTDRHTHIHTDTEIYIYRYTYTYIQIYIYRYTYTYIYLYVCISVTAKYSILCKLLIEPFVEVILYYIFYIFEKHWQLSCLYLIIISIA